MDTKEFFLHPWSSGLSQTRKEYFLMFSSVYPLVCLTKLAINLWLEYFFCKYTDRFLLTPCSFFSFLHKGLRCFNFNSTQHLLGHIMHIQFPTSKGLPIKAGRRKDTNQIRCALYLSIRLHSSSLNNLSYNLSDEMEINDKNRDDMACLAIGNSY